MDICVSISVIYIYSIMSSEVKVHTHTRLYLPSNIWNIFLFLVGFWGVVVIRGMMLKGYSYSIF